MEPNTDNNAPATGGTDLEWAYSGKAMRERFLVNCLITLVLIGGGVVASLSDWLGSVSYLHYETVWYCISGFVLGLWAYFYALYFYRTWTIRYKLTDQRLYVYRGLLTRTTDSTELVYIDDVKLSQTLRDRIFNGGVGKLVIYCSTDRTDPMLVLQGIDKPQEIFDRIDTARAAIRAKRSILTGG